MEGARRIRIARVLKSNGTEGEILMGFREFGPESFDIKEPVFIEFDGLPVPFFIEEYSLKGKSKALARLTGFKSVMYSVDIVGRDISVEEDALLEHEDEDDGFSLDGLIGWKLLDEANEYLGEITGYEDIPGNPCLYVETASGESMVPLNEDFIISIDDEACVLVMNLPEGLL